MSLYNIDMLTLNDKKGGRKIARIKGGKDDKKYLYLVEGNLDDEVLKNDETEIIIKGGKLQPLPNKNVVEKIYISAPSGAGKSTWAGAWLGEAKKMFKDDEIFIFSSITKDKALDKHDPIRITLDADLVRDPIEPEEIADSIAVFDDIDTIQNPHLRNSIADFRDYLLEQGRHFNIRLLNVGHVMMNYKITRKLLNEATAVCFFPKSGSVYHIKRYLKQYGGLEKNQIKKILKLPSRWVCLYRTFPMYIIHERGAFLVNVDDEYI
jgi:superfamily I DNA and/or RNA helicase